MNCVDGERLFSAKEAAQLGDKSATALNRIFEVCCRLSGITESDVDALEKNLEAAPAVKSGSISPS